MFCAGNRSQAEALPLLTRWVRWAHVQHCRVQRHSVCLIGVELLHALKYAKQMFVNKFLYNATQILAYDCMEERIVSRVKDEYCGDPMRKLEYIGFYQNTGYVKYHMNESAFL